ncbi:MAG: DUF4494 domain-containing protein [Muribaculaceae bacterium]|nr:DUF4494 domain-containing protein [Muribaculaceae bacterium]
MYFIVTAKYDKTQENGLVKPVKEQYLFDCVSFVDAETRAIEELSPFISGDFTIDAIKRSRISEIFNPESDKFYLAKVGFITLDEKSGIEKRSTSQILIGASDFKEAYDTFLDGMKDTVADFEVISIAEFPILEYFPTKVA